MKYWRQSEKYIYVAGHRGWPEKYPENTMEGFRAALEVGVDQIETDVRLSKDGELVLIHDSTLDRTTNGTGPVCEKTLVELKQLDAGNGAKIPTLLELMELVKDHPTITLDLELKVYPRDFGEEVSYEVCRRVLEIVDRYDFADRVVINSFSDRLNEHVYKTYGKKYRQHVFYPKAHLVDQEGVTTEPYDYAYCACVFGVNTGAVSVEEVIALHKDTGVGIWAGASTRDEASVDLAVSFGAELITCNNPDVVLQILRDKKLHD